MQYPFDILQMVATPEQRARMRFSPFAAGEVLVNAGARAESAFFLVKGIASAAVKIDGEPVDVGSAGAEVILGSADGPTYFVTWTAQRDGQLCAMPIDDLLALKVKHHDLRVAVARGDRFLQAQAQQLAACNSQHKASMRLASFLLRARDLHATDDLYFTQDALAAALGLQRGSVSQFASALSDQDIIQYSRGRIRIVDPDGLHAKACECHRSIRRQYDRIFNRALYTKAARTVPRRSG